jgi:DNA-binding IclR family transcriptional regulator
LRDLADRLGLSHSTTHRLLQVLVREGLATQRQSDRRYLPGPLIFDFGLAMSAHAEFVALAGKPLQKLARQFDAQAILFMKSGNDWVCGALAGQPAYLGGGLEPGQRRPLITSAGGVAMMIALDRAEADAVLDQNLRQLGFLGQASIDRLLRMLERSRKLGYAWNRGETNVGVHSVALPVFDRSGHHPVMASISISGSEQRMPEERVEMIVEALRQAVAPLAKQARQLFEFLD